MASLVPTKIGLGDDFLGNQAEKWVVLDPQMEMASFYNLPERVLLEAGETREILFRGMGMGGSWLIFPLMPHPIWLSERANNLEF